VFTAGAQILSGAAAGVGDAGSAGALIGAAAAFLPGLAFVQIVGDVKANRTAGTIGTRRVATSAGIKRRAT
jgi:hypothetical protein